MTVLFSNNKTINIRASTVARMFFLQEFGEELQDVLQRIFCSETTFLYDDLYKITYAMAKAENKAIGKSTSNYKQWLINIDDFDIRECLELLFDEIENGFLIKSEREETNQTSTKGITQTLMTIAIRLGISMEDLNEYTTQGFYDVVKVYSGEDEKSEWASVDEVDKFWR